MVVLAQFAPPATPGSDPLAIHLPTAPTRLWSATWVVNFAHGTCGKDESGRTLPGQVLRGQVGEFTNHNQPFLVLNHRIQGLVSHYTNGDFVL